MTDKIIISVSDAITIKDSVRIFTKEPDPMLNIELCIKGGKLNEVKNICDSDYSSIYVSIDIYDYEVIKDPLMLEQTINKKVCSVVPWICIINNVLCIDTDRFKIDYPEAEKFDWFYGYIEEKGSKGVDPKEKKFQFSFSVDGTHIDYHSKLCIPPTEIRKSILRFKEDNSIEKNTAFIITKFSDKHSKVIDLIKEKCKELGINAHIASDNKYHNNLLENVLTYIWSSKLIIVIYDNITTDLVSPNVDIELGYALALQKDIILLKEKKLQQPTDLTGIINETFDIEDINDSINNVFKRQETFLSKIAYPLHDLK